MQVDSLGFSKAGVGGHSARSMMLREMSTLVSAMPLSLSTDDFTKAIVEENVLEKPTLSSRKKSLRHLMELYSLDPSKALFRVFWELGHADLDSLPQLCLVCAYARDPATAPKLRVGAHAAPRRGSWKSCHGTAS